MQDVGKSAEVKVIVRRIGGNRSGHHVVEVPGGGEQGRTFSRAEQKDGVAVGTGRLTSFLFRLIKFNIQPGNNER